MQSGSREPSSGGSGCNSCPELRQGRMASIMLVSKRQRLGPDFVKVSKGGGGERPRLVVVSMLRAHLTTDGTRRGILVGAACAIALLAWSLGFADALDGILEVR